jgi:sialic acid synthase SpsE/D-lyxose ketol-isomerase
MISPRPLIVFEMANNHGGSLEKGLEIINTFQPAIELFPEFDFCIKFQYRNLDTFIHEKYKNDVSFKYIKRFKDTELKEEDFLTMLRKAKSVGFLTMVTPFDNESVKKIRNHPVDIVKIASCSLNDWPLLEDIVLLDKEIVLSTAGSSLEDIERVVSFFNHRNKNISLMHCRAEYPTSEYNLELNQIDLLRKTFPSLRVGYSTHEDPMNFDAVQVAYAKGATIFEKHIDLECETINSYSINISQCFLWLDSLIQAIDMCGETKGRYKITAKEKQDLFGLRRGVFAKKDLKVGEKLDSNNIIYAIPLLSDDHITANDMSKYAEYTIIQDIKKGEPVTLQNVCYKNLRSYVIDIIDKLKDIVIKSNIVLPEEVELELSHHYGIEKYNEVGVAIFNCINREYCKKLLALLPNQTHPSHYHVEKEETFHVLYGDLVIITGTQDVKLKAGDIYTMHRKVPHGFYTKDGCVFEEISTTHIKNDSFYQDKKIMDNFSNRKTSLTFLTSWLHEGIK